MFFAIKKLLEDFDRGKLTEERLAMALRVYCSYY